MTKPSPILRALTSTPQLAAAIAATSRKSLADVYEYLHLHWECESVPMPEHKCFGYRLRPVSTARIVTSNRLYDDSGISRPHRLAKDVV